MSRNDVWVVGLVLLGIAAIVIGVVFYLDRMACGIAALGTNICG